MENDIRRLASKMWHPILHLLQMIKAGRVVWRFVFHGAVMRHRGPAGAINKDYFWPSARGIALSNHFSKDKDQVLLTIYAGKEESWMMDV